MKRKKEYIYDGARALTQYRNEIYNLYLSKYKFESESIGWQDSFYCLKNFWAVGSVAAFVIKNTNMLKFVQYAPNYYNNEDFPTSCFLVDKRGFKWIPTKEMKVGQDVVIGYAQPNTKPISFMVDYYLHKIVRIEELMYTNENKLKMPFLITANFEERTRLENLIDEILSGNDKVIISAEDYQAIKALILNAPYLLDKLQKQKEAIKNELLTYLGLQNTGAEKKERLLFDEVNANNEVINDSSNCFTEMMNHFCDDIKEVFGIDIKLVVNKNVDANSMVDFKEDAADENQEQ